MMVCTWCAVRIYDTVHHQVCIPSKANRFFIWQFLFLPKCKPTTAATPWARPSPAQPVSVTITTICCEGRRNGYFHALLTTDELNSAQPLPGLSSFWSDVSHSASHTLSALATQLSFCAAQRISTLHEQLLHQHYTCPLIFADPPLNAATAPTADSQHSSQAQEVANAPTAGLPAPDLHHSGRNGEVTAEVSTEVSTGIQAELQQLSDQVLQHAATLLKPQTDNLSGSMPSSRGPEQTERLEYQPRTDFWLVMSPLLPTLALYASPSSLLSFIRVLFSCSIPDLMPTSDSASSTNLSSASASATTMSSASSTASDAAAAQVIAGCLGQRGFIEQPQLQQAWLQAIQLELLAAVTKLNSATAASFMSPESLHAQRGNTSKKRRKSQGKSSVGAAQGSVASEGLTQMGCGPATNPDLHQVLMQTLLVVTPFLAIPRPAASENASGADGKHSSKNQASSASKKRKTAELSSSQAAQSGPSLRHVTGLLQHVALMPLAMLSSTHATLLAQLLLQTQLSLAQSAVTFATAATANAKADSALNLTIQALSSSQQGIVKCLKGSSDAAAGLLLHAGPQLWHWLPAVVQLTSHVQAVMPPSSINKLRSDLTPHPQVGSSTPNLSLKQHSLAAGSVGSPGSECGGTASIVHGISTSMLEDMSAGMRCLACYCLGVRQASRSPTADVAGDTAGSASAGIGAGFETFVNWLATELQVCVFPSCHVMT